MATGSDTAERIQRVLIKEANFDPSLLERDYRFGHRKSIPLAGFAYRPLDARSACLGFATAAAGKSNVSDYRDLGAPLLLLESNDAFELWRVGSNADDDKCIEVALSIDGMGRYFSEHANVLQPGRIYEAKTFARIDSAPAYQELFADFVDPELLPVVESRMGERLTGTVVEAIRELVGVFGPAEWVIKAVFRLLAGKILRDKNVPGFKSLTLSHVDHVLQKVERHYGSKDPLKMNKKKAVSLQKVMARMQQLGDLRNLSTESLGDVYEQALIAKDIRKIHSTHKTPSYLVDYIVWQLAKWIEEIPRDDLRFFEPGCGHAPFLVSSMRMLRTLDMEIPNLSQFFRERFLGVDNDPFALEIARLSLTLADEPNPDGWEGLTEADMFAGNFLEEMASRSTVMLTNPPYETRKAEEILYRTLPQLPVGAVFGAVVPATLLFSDKPRAIKLRSWIATHCQLAEVDLFPDGLFTFADHECAVLIGRKLDTTASTKSLQSRLRRVRDNEAARASFKLDYVFSSTRIYAQAIFAESDENPLWIAEFQNEIWEYLRKNDPLASIAEVGKGLEFKGRDKPKGAKTVEDSHFVGSQLGFISSSGDWGLHEHPPMKYLSLSPSVIRRPGTGTDCVAQVLLNYHPVRREFWSLKPFIDKKGRPFQSNFLSIRPLEERTVLTFLWALLLSPLANLYVYSHLLKRNIVPRVIRRFPIPMSNKWDVARVASHAERYLMRAQSGKCDLFNPDGFTEEELSNLLHTLDAEVLRLYALPAKSERFLLEQFRGEQRPGIPIEFTEYFPPDTPDVPLYVYLSESYQRWLDGGSPDLSKQELSKYEALVMKAEAGQLTKREADRLYQLQAEVDGRDYAMQCPSGVSDIESSTNAQFEQRLRVLSDRAASASVKRG